MPFTGERKRRYDREYRKKNGAILRERSRTAWAAHGQKWQTRQEFLKTPAGGYNALRAKAKRCKRELAISFNKYCEIVALQRCAYCNADLSGFGGHKLDRVNNKLGYRASNVVMCCGPCNLYKGLLERWHFRGKELLRMVLARGNGHVGCGGRCKS